MKKALACIAIAALLSGCQSAESLAQKLNEFDRLGIKRATITGKFSNTDYVVERTADGKRKATLDHSNAWVPKVHIERETEDAK